MCKSRNMLMKGEGTTPYHFSSPAVTLKHRCCNVLLTSIGSRFYLKRKVFGTVSAVLCLNLLRLISANILLRRFLKSMPCIHVVVKWMIF